MAGELLSEEGLQDSLYTSANNDVDIVVENQGTFMSLTPFFSHTDDGATIHLPMWKPITVTEGLQQEQITAWHQKYRKEYAGLINRADSIESRSYSSIQKDVWQDIVTPLLKPNHETTLLVGHPGTGVADILPSVLRHSQQDTSDTQWMFWDVVRI